MKIFTVEKNTDGLYSALFYAFTKKQFPDGFILPDCPAKNFTDEYITIPVNLSDISRIKNAVLRYGGVRTENAIKICLLSCEDTAMTIAFNFCREMLDKKQCVLENLSLKTTTDFLYCVNRVIKERHRFMGFLRFKESASGVLYAPYSPDNDITVMLMPHFIKRLNSPFIIHDVKRNFVGISDGKTFKTLKTEKQASITLSETEKECENLFKTYFAAVTIKERKNLKLQTSLLPKKYRRFMTENDVEQ